MATFAIALLLVLLALGGLALGVIAGRPPLRGSCGGAGCAACGGSCTGRKEGEGDA